MPSPRVFIIQEPLKMVDGVAVPRINYGTLMPFGEVKFLYSWGEITDRMPLDNMTGYLARTRTALADFTDADYLAPMGHPGLIAIATLAAAEANDGRIKLLDWSRESRDYRVVHIDLDHEP